MRGHQHLGDPSLTQNQGNVLGSRPCVRQSRLYREHVGGNAMKELMGQEVLKWDTTHTQGVYAGVKVFDHNAASTDTDDSSINSNNITKDGGVQKFKPHLNSQQGRRGIGATETTGQYGAMLEGEGEEYDYDGAEEVMIDCLEESPSPPMRSLHPKQQQQQQQSSSRGTQKQQQKQPPHETSTAAASPLAGRSFRPGAGQANRQTYNIFTGE